MRTGLAAVRFGWTAFVVPFLFVAAPSLLLDGSPLEVGWATATALAGVFLACVGVVGYLFRPIAWPHRLVAVLAGLLMLIPADAFEGAIYTDLAGIALAVAFVGFEFLRRREFAPKSPSAALEIGRDPAAE
jgi:TRAP-type uncharacterized transport system fused permease subunit